MPEKVRITVLKKLRVNEVFEKYAKNLDPKCPVLRVGDVFEVKPEEIEMPEGFCSWAWADIHRDVAHLALGGDFPWIKQRGTMISSCTDGLRPVIFKLERIKEE
jgi:uncharacterized repeat protein (TIGR04076 family)